jgi:hypothetical protein
MQNDLYGPPINRRSQPRLNGGGGGNCVEQYELGYDEEIQNRDPVDLPLDDYYVNRFRPRRPFMNRFRRGGGGRGRFASQRGYNNRPPYGIFDLDSYVPMLIDEGIQQRNHRSSFNVRTTIHSDTLPFDK